MLTDSRLLIDVWMEFHPYMFIDIVTWYLFFEWCLYMFYIKYNKLIQNVNYCTANRDFMIKYLERNEFVKICQDLNKMSLKLMIKLFRFCFNKDPKTAICFMNNSNYSEIIFMPEKNCFCVLPPELYSLIYELCSYQTSMDLWEI